MDTPNVIPKQFSKIFGRDLLDTRYENHFFGKAINYCTNRIKIIRKGKSSNEINRNISPRFGRNWEGNKFFCWWL